MAGFEVIVRPVVFPNIRPAPARALAPEDNPDQGIAVLGGSGGRLIDLPHSYSTSVSQQKPHTESKRQFDKERIYQVGQGGSTRSGEINRNNYIDVERLKKVRLNTEGGALKMIYSNPPPAANVETLETDVVR